ncbi:MAG TPA: hypothetical protein VHL14_14470 [Steroidobacteraceae bacterium]|nr:hypothetical protein [Steroidobacteraceae bacterium]
MLGMVNTACSRSEQTPEHAKEICTGQFPMTDQGDINAVLPTDSGMHGLWNPHAFKSVCSQGEWEKLFVENRNIEASIKAGIFVPMYVHSDGSPLIHVRIARNDTKAALLANEMKYVNKKSDAYLFVSTGALAVSGIEYIGRLAPMASRITPLAAGRWSVQVIELNAPHDPDGKASSGIPDMVVLVNPESSPATKYRQSVETFD